jgi:hypothetical protein
MGKRTNGYFAVTAFEPGYETQEQATDAGRDFVAKDPSQHVSIVYVQLVHTITPETEVQQQSSLLLNVNGVIDNGPPAEEPTHAKETREMLEQAAQLVTDTQLELKACRNRIREQEAELRELREELSKPEGV